MVEVAGEASYYFSEGVIVRSWIAEPAVSLKGQVNDGIVNSGRHGIA